MYFFTIHNNYIFAGNTIKTMKTNQLIYTIIGAAMEVHNTLGSGFLESVYQEALAIELKSKNVTFIKEKKLEINYKGITLNKIFYADFICEGIIIELKCTGSITSEHIAQTLNYIKATNLREAIILNFGTKSLEFKCLII